METVKSANTTVVDKRPGAEENVTQSLEQLVKKRLKETAKSIKRKLDDTTLVHGGAVPFPMHTQQTSELQAKAGRWFVQEQTKRMALAMPGSESEMSRPATSTVSLSDDGGRQLLISSHTKSTGENARTLSHSTTLSGIYTDKAALMAQRDVPTDNDVQAPTQPMSETSDDALHVMTRHTQQKHDGQNTSINSSVTTSQSVRQPEAGIVGESDEAAFMSVSAEQPRNTASVLRATENTAQPATSRHTPPADVMAARVMNAAPAETTSDSKMVYRFSDWGDGHQVSVQLGGQAKAVPHMLQASDPLVHQRLADYEGQGQGEPEWVFSDEQEQPKKSRQQHTDEETA